MTLAYGEVTVGSRGVRKFSVVVMSSRASQYLSLQLWFCSVLRKRSNKVKAPVLSSSI